MPAVCAARSNGYGDGTARFGQLGGRLQTARVDRAVIVVRDSVDLASPYVALGEPLGRRLAKSEVNFAFAAAAQLFGQRRKRSQRRDIDDVATSLLYTIHC